MDVSTIRGAEPDTPARSIVTDPMDATMGIDVEMMEALFFAYRDFISSADRDLERRGFGRAHHRVLHFVNRSPGLTVAELLEPLGITKQGLSRTLKQLVDAGLVAQRTHRDDRRQRHLYPTREGRELALSLAEPQSRRIAAALHAMGSGEYDARAVVRRFLEGMVMPNGASERLEGRADGIDSRDPS